MATPSNDLPDNPFVAGPMIKDPRLFVGRKQELARLFNLMQQPVSANVTGDHRIGKSSLLYHIYQTWESRVQQPDHYCVVYLDLQDAQCSREVQFYGAVMRALQRQLRNPSILTNLPDTLNRQSFGDAIRQCGQAGILPVLCLDCFEALFDHTQQFDDGFYDNLRALMNASQVMLILSSRKSLDVYKRRHRLTSDFFNLGQILHLGELEPTEVKELLRLPARDGSNLSPVLGTMDQQIAREWGDRHPFKLQHAANFLYQASREGHNVAWARQQFLREERRLPRRRQKTNPIRVIKNLGRLARGVGNTADDVGNLMAGTVIVSVLFLAIVGVLTREDVREFFNKLMGG